MSHPESRTTTLAIPEEHFEQFRRAALRELSDNAEWLVEQAQEALMSPNPGTAEDAEDALADERGPFSSVAAASALIRDLLAGKREVTCRTATLAHACEGMAEQMKDNLGVEYTPVDDTLAQDAAQRADAFAWSMRTAARLHSDREAVAA